MAYGIIYNTDKNWFNYLKSEYNGGEVNFWTPRDPSRADIKTNLNIPFFFKTHGGTIVGMGELIRKEFLTIDEMWSSYGTMNGTDQPPANATFSMYSE